MAAEDQRCLDLEHRQITAAAGSGTPAAPQAIAVVGGNFSRPCVDVAPELAQLLENTQQDRLHAEQRLLVAPGRFESQQVVEIAVSERVRCLPSC